MRGMTCGLNAKCLEMFGCVWVSIRFNAAPLGGVVHRHPRSSTSPKSCRARRYPDRGPFHVYGTQHIVAGVLRIHKYCVSPTDTVDKAPIVGPRFSTGARDMPLRGYAMDFGE